MVVIGIPDHLMEMDKKEVKSTSLSSYDIHQFISIYSTLSTTNRILYYYMHVSEMTHFWCHLLHSRLHWTAHSIHCSIIDVWFVRKYSQYHNWIAPSLQHHQKRYIKLQRIKENTLVVRTVGAFRKYKFIIKKKLLRPGDKIQTIFLKDFPSNHNHMRSLLKLFLSRLCSSIELNTRISSLGVKSGPIVGCFPASLLAINVTYTFLFIGFCEEYAFEVNGNVITRCVTWKD